MHEMSCAWEHSHLVFSTFSVGVHLDSRRKPEAFRQIIPTRVSPKLMHIKAFKIKKHFEILKFKYSFSRCVSEGGKLAEGLPTWTRSTSIKSNCPCYPSLFLNNKIEYWMRPGWSQCQSKKKAMNAFWRTNSQRMENIMITPLLLRA